MNQSNPNYILNKLIGGDRRSVGNADAVAKEVSQNPQLFAPLFAALKHFDPVIRMRAADALEKATRRSPSLLAPYKSDFLNLLATATQQEICWHLAQMAPRLDLTTTEKELVVSTLKKYLQHKSKIVRVSALDALATISLKEKTIRDEVISIIKEQIASGIPSLVARGNKLLRRLDATPER